MFISIGSKNILIRIYVAAFVAINQLMIYYMHLNFMSLLFDLLKNTIYEFLKMPSDTFIFPLLAIVYSVYDLGYDVEAGFKMGAFCVLHTLRIIIEHRVVFRSPLLMLFIYYANNFNSSFKVADEEIEKFESSDLLLQTLLVYVYVIRPRSHGKEDSE